MTESDAKFLALQGLKERIARLTEHQELHTTAIAGLSLFRRSEPTEPQTGMYEPSICLVVQGKKRVILGEDSFVYDSDRYLLTSLHLPTIVQLLEASPEQPYLGLRLTFDLNQISQLMADSQLPPPKSLQSSLGMMTGGLTVALIEAFSRLVGLLEDTQDIPILAPIIHREIIYRLLTGEQGQRLRQIASAGSQSQQIARAIHWLKENYARQLKVEDLASRASMSTSTFHHHFRAMTALSPLQYQKKLRLQEARRLMLSEHFDAATAALEVGYESPSQFSREYSRLFGAPPLRDISRLREDAVNG